MPSDTKQYGSKQEGPALTTGDAKGKPVDYTRPAAMTPSSTAASMKDSDHQG